MYVVVAYDVPDDRRRNRILKILKDYGDHVQYSLFECRISDEHYVVMRDRLEAEIDPAEDSIRFYFLCQRCQGRIERIGGKEPPDPNFLIIE